ncbi:Protein fam72a [Actinomortierella wolfii]|nr:Protein fam72a [Actinomortierella wolfii]
MARGSPGTVVPSTVVQSGTFIPPRAGLSTSATTATTTENATPGYSNFVTSRNSHGSYGLRRATATLAEPMRSASRSSSISSLPSPTTGSAAVAAVAAVMMTNTNEHNRAGRSSNSSNSNFMANNNHINHSNNSSQTSLGSQTTLASTQPYRPLRGPRNPPAEMTEASLRSFASHRAGTAVQQPGRGGVDSNNGHIRVSPMPYPSAFHPLISTTTTSVPGTVQNSIHRNNGNGNNSSTEQGYWRNPHPQQQMPQLNRQQVEEHFRRMSAHAASTLSSANQWPISNANLDNHRSTARGVLSTGGSANDPAFDAQVVQMANIRLNNGVEQNGAYMHETSHYPHPVGPRYPANAATGGAGIRGRDETRDVRHQNTVGRTPQAARSSSHGSRSSVELSRRVREEDDVVAGPHGGRRMREEETEESADSGASTEDSPGEEDDEADRRRALPTPGAPRMSRHEAFRRPPHHEGSRSLDGRPQHRNMAPEGLPSITHGHPHRAPLPVPPPRRSQSSTLHQPSYQQNNNHDITLPYSQPPPPNPASLHHAIIDEYTSPRPSSTYRSLPRTTSSSSTASQTSITYSQHYNNNNQQQPQQQQQQQQPVQQPTSQQSIHPHETTVTPPRPAFLSQPVYQLACAACIRPLCLRAMKAVMLSDHSKELYSTDMPPSGLQLVNDDRQVRHCACRIRDRSSAPFVKIPKM